MGNVKHGKRLYKQMALEVAVRNPERYEDFLRVFNKFEGRVLNDEGILDIYTALFTEGVIVTDKIDIASCSEDQIKRFIVKNLSHNNEWGFPTGYQAGFTRYLKTLSEFGFIYSQYNEPLKISEVAKALINGKLTLSEAFALQSMRFWRKSPYRRVLNDFNFFSFILKVIQKREEQGKKLSYPQFMLALFSENGDVEAFINLIENNKVGHDQEKAYQLAYKTYHRIDAEHGSVCKMDTSFRDYGNTVFRVMQLTGFITVEYSGVMMLSLNKSREGLLNKLLSLEITLPETAKDDEVEYFEHIGALPTPMYLYIVESRPRAGYMAGYNEKLEKIVQTYNLTEKNVAEYLQEVSDSANDRRAFWFIQAPLKFEFLLSLYMYLCYSDEYEYQPNYLCDDAGIPYSHAPGNIGDIEVFNTERYWLIEATLIRNKTQQVNSETINLFRHIDSSKPNTKYLCLVAPYIHEDTELMIKVGGVVSMVEKSSLLFDKPYNTADFIKLNAKKCCLDDMQNHTFAFAKKLGTLLSTMTV